MLLTDVNVSTGTRFFWQESPFFNNGPIPSKNAVLRVKQSTTSPAASG